MCGHASTGYTLILMLGKIIWPNTDCGIICMQIAVAMVSIFAFGGIVNAIFKDISQIDKTIMTSIYAFSPFVLGMVGDVSLDYGMLCMFVVLIYCWVKKKILLEFFVGIIFCFTKEPAVIIYGGYLLGRYIVLIKTIKKNNFSLRCIFKQPNIYIASIPPMIWLIAFFLKGEMWGSSGGGQSNYFGYSPLNIITKIKQFTILNFNWLLWITILAICIYFIANKKKKLNISKYSIPICGAMIFFVLFNCIYITVTHARYILPMTVFTSLGLGLVCSNIVNNLVRRCILGGICVLLLVQSFWGIDPFTSNVFASIDVGEKKISCLTYNSNKEIDDAIIYNREYLQYVDLLNEVFKQLKIDENCVLAVDGNSFLSYWLEGPYGLQWNKDKQKLQRSAENSTISLDIINLEERRMYTGKRILYLKPTWIVQEEGNVLDAEKIIISHNGWEMIVYEFGEND